jgi:hypothetical protein
LDVAQHARGVTFQENHPKVASVVFGNDFDKKGLS